LYYFSFRNEKSVKRLFFKETQPYLPFTHIGECHWLVVCLIRPPARTSKIPFSKLDFCPKLMFGVSKHDNGRPESGSVVLRRLQFWSWKAFFAQK
jgi:hypothetical protein